MIEADLLPESVDQLPEREKDIMKAMDELDYRPGHLFDPTRSLQIFGVKAVDSTGDIWRVYEDRQGVFKMKVVDVVEDSSYTLSLGTVSGDAIAHG